ncbi:hypothetical protein [Sorangium atrum]|uniref:GNAT family N-acetyltransferase n=1 Tax=Sorangium atrum TaxID=2995308 RepID=A0ABT5C505_9BACT|nr:hypothetical protein [Sorangium aterium]MDC0681033.1 hypothetical protein [Sorangium aterium]
MSHAQIAPAAAGDLDVVRELLAQSELPTTGLLDQFPAAYVVMRRGLELVGVAGLEMYGRAGLLRSVAVVRTLHGRRRSNPGAHLMVTRTSALPLL